MVASAPFQLSPMDATMSPYWFTVLYVFPRPADAAHAFDLEKLHTSFCALIDQDFPLFMGRMHIDKNGVVSVLPRESGSARSIIEFIKTQSETLTTAQVVEERSMALLPSRGVPIISFDRKLVCSARLMAVKCTLLSDGGLVIGIDTSHAMWDAQGMATFMNAWSEHYRGVVPRTPICHDRQLMAASGSDSTMDHPEFHILEHDPNATPLEFPPIPCTQTVFRLPRESLTKLKALASSGCSASSTVPYVSTLDAVSALFTILITQARSTAQAQIRVTTSVNARKRLQPPLPKSYEGNAVFFGLSNHETASDLLAPVSPETLSSVAQRIRASINACDHTQLRDALEFVALQRDWASVQSNINFFFGPDVTFTSWCDLGIYDADFHSRPWYVGPGRQPLVDGVVIFMDGIQGADAVDSMVGLEAQTMKRMEQLWHETVAALGLKTAP